MKSTKPIKKVASKPSLPTNGSVLSPNRHTDPSHLYAHMRAAVAAKRNEIERCDLPTAERRVWFAEKPKKYDRLATPPQRRSPGALSPALSPQPVQPLVSSDLAGSAAFSLGGGVNSKNATFVGETGAKNEDGWEEDNGGTHAGTSRSLKKSPQRKGSKGAKGASAFSGFVLERPVEEISSGQNGATEGVTNSGKNQGENRNRQGSRRQSRFKSERGRARGGRGGRGGQHSTVQF